MPGDGKLDYGDERHLLLNSGQVTTEHSLQQSGRRLFQAARVRNRRAWWPREEWKGWACTRDIGACRGGGAEEYTSQLLSEVGSDSDDWPGGWNGSPNV